MGLGIREGIEINIVKKPRPQRGSFARARRSDLCLCECVHNFVILAISLFSTGFDTNGAHESSKIAAPSCAVRVQSLTG